MSAYAEPSPSAQVGLVPSRSAAALTLVELLIAITLSLMVVGAATAAFSVTAKVIGRCEILSRQNQAVRDAYLACADDADYWWSSDDPFASGPGRRPMRTVTGGTGDGGNGQPFVPIDLPDEYWNWRVTDPRTWQRSLSFRQASLIARDHSILSRLDDSDPERAWHHVQSDQIFNLLGIYGYADLMPPCVDWWYSLGSERTNSFGDAMQVANILDRNTPPNVLGQLNYIHGGFPEKFIAAVRGPKHMDWSNGSRVAITLWTYLGIAPRPSWASQYNPARDLPLLDLVAQRVVTSDTSEPINFKTQALELAASPPHLRLRPAGWPIVRGGLLRTENAAGRSAMMALTLIEPSSGERTTFSFLIPGSSLRGARGQRDWPHWDPGARLNQ